MDYSLCVFLTDASPNSTILPGSVAPTDEEILSHKAMLAFQYAIDIGCRNFLCSLAHPSDIIVAETIMAVRNLLRRYRILISAY